MGALRLGADLRAFLLGFAILAAGSGSKRPILQRVRLAYSDWAEGTGGMAFARSEWLFVRSVTLTAMKGSPNHV